MNKTIEAGNVQCIRIAHIAKIDEVARHFDQVLGQLLPYVGEISRFQIWECADSHKPNAETTEAWLQLKDPTKTHMALVALNKAHFHGHQFEAKTAW